MGVSTNEPTIGVEGVMRQISGGSTTSRQSDVLDLPIECSFSIMNILTMARFDINTNISILKSIILAQL